MSSAPGPHLRRLRGALLVPAIVLAAWSLVTEGQSTRAERSQAFQELDEKYQRWLRSVRGLISQAELDYFLGLREDFRRDAFMEAFWGPRDPDPQTPVNELRARWEQFKDASGQLPYGDPRFLLLLFNGPPGGWNLPDGRPAARCFSRARELEIWFYDGSERVARKFPVILLREQVDGPYVVYRQGGPLRPVQRSGGLPSTDIRLLCADELLRYTVREITRIRDYDDLLDRVLSPTVPSPEWLDTFSASAADVPEGAETFQIEAEVSFPSRRQSRAAVRVILAVSSREVPGRRFEGELFHHFRVLGEVVRGGRLFEGFRYRFEGPTPEGVDVIPLGFTRYLRPGSATLRLLVHDVFADRYAQVVRQIDVPRPEGLPEEAAEKVAARERPALELFAPSGAVLTGLVRFSARASEEIDKVTFFLDERPVFSKRQPPFSVELDLGREAAPHRLRAVGYSGDREVARDQIWVNQRAQRFRVRFLEPRPGGIYPGSLTARVQVETPDGAPPARVELSLDGSAVATLTEAPYVQAIRLPGSDLAVVRAVAFLEDGSSAEEVVVVNSSAFLEEIEVRLVEHQVLVVDRRGRPIRGLEGSVFRVFEDGVEQRIRRFEEASTAPLRVAMLIDRSGSMRPHLGRVAEAAASFAAAALRSPEDRLGVFSFTDRLATDVGFTPALGQVERALAGLVAGGGTALYDSLVQVLQSFAGGRGVEAVLLYSDGRDEDSALSFDQALDAARRSGIALYVVGLESAFLEETRRSLESLASETGGQAFFVPGLEELPGTYATILEELRARYLLAYQPSTPGRPGDFQPVRVEVDADGARVKARTGYYR